MAHAHWLITGGCGFIGRSLIRHLLTMDDVRIRVLDNLSVGTREDLLAVGSPVTEDDNSWCADAVELVVGDILEESDVARAAEGAHRVVHLAANTGVPQSVADPLFDGRTNVLGTLNVLEAARGASVGRVVFASSGAPLGVQNPPLHEELAPHPASPYGASKLAGEGYCCAYFHCYGLETVTLRFGNVYGEGSDKKGSVVAKFIKQALAGETLEIYGDGSQTRDFIHIDDLVAAILAAARSPGVGGETFQIASAQETTVSEITELIVDTLVAQGVTRPQVIHANSRQGDVARNFSDTSKARRMLKWSPRVDLREGLARTVRSFLSPST